MERAERALAALAGLALVSLALGVALVGLAASVGHACGTWWGALTAAEGVLAAAWAAVRGARSGDTGGKEFPLAASADDGDADGDARPLSARARSGRKRTAVKASLGAVASALVVVSLVLVVIRAASPDDDFAAFPQSCGTKEDGCARIASVSPHRDDGLVPMLVDATAADVRAAVLAWGEHKEARGAVLDEGASLLHFRFLSRFWGFADDFVVSLTCDGAATLVQAQSQLRIGRSDFGVNTERLERLWKHLASLQLAPGACSGTG